MEYNLSRRDFIKMGITISSTALLASAPKWAYAGGTNDVKSPMQLVKGYCPFCQVRCTYQARIENGKVINFIGEKDNKWTGGAMCSKGLSMVELVNSPYRLTKAMVRTPNGLEPISYPDAIKLIADKLKASKAKRGDDIGKNLALTSPLWDCRESEISALMTMRLAGCVNIMPPGEVCISTSSNLLKTLLGTFNSTTTVNEIVNAETLVLWGANISETYPPYTRWLDEAKSKGTHIILIDCRKTPTSAWAEYQLMPLPGTDGALALGAVKYLIDTNTYNAEAVERTCTGFPRLMEDVQNYTIEEVAKHTLIPSKDILKFYKTLSASKSTIMWLSGSLCRYTNGLQTIRTLIAMQGITDNYSGPGKGLLTMEGGKPDGEKEFIDETIGATDKDGVIFRRLLQSMNKGELDVLFLNSSYRRYPDSNNVREAIKKVDFVVHRGFFMTEEVEVADLFIPATFSLESQGSHYGAEKQVVWRDKALEAPGECVPDWQFYKDIGMAIAPDKFPDFKDPAELNTRFQQHVKGWEGITLERIKASPDGLIWPLYSLEDKERTGTMYPNAKFLTEDGKLPLDLKLFGKYEWSVPRGHPNGPDRDEKYPLIFTQGKVATHWQQTLTNFSSSLAQVTDERYVQIHPDTAKSLNIAHNDKVLLETATGSIAAVAVVTSAIMPNVVFTPSHYTNSSPYSQTKSEAINSIIPNYWDRISAQFNGVGCRLVKQA